MLKAFLWEKLRTILALAFVQSNSKKTFSHSHYSGAKANKHMPWIFMKKIRVKLYIVETTLAGKPDIYISLTSGLELEGAELIWCNIFLPIMSCDDIILLIQLLQKKPENGKHLIFGINFWMLFLPLSVKK